MKKLIILCLLISISFILPNISYADNNNEENNFDFAYTFNICTGYTPNYVFNRQDFMHGAFINLSFGMSFDEPSEIILWGVYFGYYFDAPHYEPGFLSSYGYEYYSDTYVFAANLMYYLNSKSKVFKPFFGVGFGVLWAIDPDELGLMGTLVLGTGTDIMFTDFMGINTMLNIKLSGYVTIGFEVGLIFKIKIDK